VLFDKLPHGRTQTGRSRLMAACGGPSRRGRLRHIRPRTLDANFDSPEYVARCQSVVPLFQHLTQYACRRRGYFDDRLIRVDLNERFMDLDHVADLAQPAFNDRIAYVSVPAQRDIDGRGDNALLQKVMSA
jgi:hypothetical protein